MNNPYCKQFPISSPIVITDKLSKIGALVTGSMTITDKIAILNSLGNLQYTRDAVILADYPQSNSHFTYDKYIAAGKKVLLNLNWDRDYNGTIPVPFPTDMTLYTAKINAVLDDIAAPEIVVIENEELNPNYHSGPLSDYFTMIQTAAPIVHGRGLKLTNGGITKGSHGLDGATFRYLKATYDEATALLFGNNAMIPSQVNAANNPGSNPTFDAAINEIISMLDIYKINCDYINIHAYEDLNPNDSSAAVTAKTTFTQYVFKYYKEYVEAYTGLSAITNETGIKFNTQPDLIKSMMENYVNLQLAYFIWFDGVGKGGAVALNDQFAPFALQPNGEAFRDFMILYNMP